MRKVVCVTGAAGYIASWIVKLLLQRGYTVNATVLSLGDPNEVVHLKALEGADERLHLLEANLIDEGSFDSAVQGCEGVFHTASPVLFKTTDLQKELIDPAVKGTINVLTSCKKVSSIKRVVITSSMASVLLPKNPPRQDFVDESWFSDPDLCEESKVLMFPIRNFAPVRVQHDVNIDLKINDVNYNFLRYIDSLLHYIQLLLPQEWYALAKTLAEKSACKFAQENGIDLVTLHPCFVIGPLLQPTLNFSSACFLDLIKEGKELLPSGIYRYVDVRDVAEAHILAFENPSANGRYLLVGRTA